MTNDERHNPFENHIESDDFDVSKLGEPGQSPLMDALRIRVKALLDGMPQPVDNRIMDELDDHQKHLCMVLTDELVRRLIRPQFSEQLREVSDDDLIYMMSAPIAAAILAEARINQDITPPQESDDNRTPRSPFSRPFPQSRPPEVDFNRPDDDDFDEDFHVGGFGSAFRSSSDDDPKPRGSFTFDRNNISGSSPFSRSFRSSSESRFGVSPFSRPEKSGSIFAKRTTPPPPPAIGQALVVLLKSIAYRVRLGLTLLWERLI